MRAAQHQTVVVSRLAAEVGVHGTTILPAAAAFGWWPQTLKFGHVAAVSFRQT